MDLLRVSETLIAIRLMEATTKEKQPGTQSVEVNVFLGINKEVILLMLTWGHTTTAETLTHHVRVVCGVIMGIMMMTGDTVISENVMHVI